MTKKMNIRRGDEQNLFLVLRPQKWFQVSKLHWNVYLSWLTKIVIDKITEIVLLQTC